MNLRYLLSCFSVMGACVAAPANDPFKAAKLSAEPGGQGVRLVGRDAWTQLLVTGHDAAGATRDLSRAAAYIVEPAGLVHIDRSGLVTPHRDGQGKITARVGGLSASVPVRVERFAAGVPIHFANDVVPIFTRLGCNAGGCHGKAGGQNGFRLSLLGFEPEEDYEYLVKEGRGRRLFPASPSHSLLLVKATGQTPHGGGKKLEVGSPFYQLLVRWVAQGAPYGRPDDPTVTGIEVLPRQRILRRGGEQQLAVIARLSDGSTRDVTRMTTFEANQADMAEVSDTGLVQARRVPGRLSVMARFQSHVDVFRATIPLGVEVTRLPPTRNFIDEHVFRQLKELGLPPSDLCDDATFVRRATIDLTGRLPTRQQVEEFASDKDPKKHEKLVARLLTGGDHADYFANKWSALLRNRRASAQDSTAPTFAFHAWIRQAIAENKPYDAFVRAVLTATGEEIKSPPVVWFRELKSPGDLVEDAAQLFLGQRIGCAKCHHHPFEKWSQDDYYGMTAFFSTVEVKLPLPPKKGKQKAKKGEKVPEPIRVATVSVRNRPAQAVNPRTGRPVRPTGLGGRPLPLAAGDDPRVKLAEWMTAKDNPYFARALVNRYWKHFMGRGLVDPEDDMRLTNPASNPELLDALARSFVDNGHDTRKLIATICGSTAYRLSAVPNAHNAADRQSYSRFLPRRLHAEVLLDAIDVVTGAKTAFKGVPAGTRAVQLPDNLFDSYFLSVFGRPDAASACECERSGESSLAQCLHMLNSQEIQNKVSGPRARELARDRRPHVDRLRELYQIALSREPSKEETQALLAHIEKKGRDVQAAYEDILWALINTKEFLFNH